MADAKPDIGAVGAVAASNLVAPLGVFALGWSATVLLGVFVAELAALVWWSLLKMPFAAKRPRAHIEQSRIVGLVYRLRGSISLPGPLPPVYPRNAPTMLGGLVFGPLGIVLALAMLGYVASSGVTDAEAAATVVGALVVFLLRGGETYVEYFRHEGYRDHSARSAFREPLLSFFGVGLLLAVAVALDAGSVTDASRGAETLAIMAVGKLALDLRGLQIEADDDRHGVLSRMFGGKEIEVEPPPIEEPETEPQVTARPPRRARIVDACYRGLVYVATSGTSVFSLSVTLVTGLVGGVAAGVAVGAVLLLGFAAARAVARYLTYGAVEYRCYGGLLVVHSTLLGEGQARLRRQGVDGLAVQRDPVDRLFDTETLELDAEGPDTTPDLGLPDPDDPDPDDVNADRPRTLAHVSDVGAVVDALGVRWMLERDGEDSVEPPVTDRESGVRGQREGQ